MTETTVRPASCSLAHGLTSNQHPSSSCVDIPNNVYFSLKISDPNRAAKYECLMRILVREGALEQDIRIPVVVICDSKETCVIVANRLNLTAGPYYARAFDDPGKVDVDGHQMANINDWGRKFKLAVVPVSKSAHCLSLLSQNSSTVLRSTHSMHALS